MKDFDLKRREREEKDRTFRIGGEDFRYRAAVAPESILAWSEFSASGDQPRAELAAAQAALAAVQAEVPEEGDAAQLAAARAIHAREVAKLTAKVAEKTAEVEASVKPESEWLEIIDNTVTAILEPEFAETWEKVRDVNLPHPLSLGDLQELLEWLVQEVVASPTKEPSDSSDSAGDTATTSTDGSSSQEAPELVGSTPAN